MAVVCAHCGSADVEAQFDTVCCLNCGCHTDGGGGKTLPSSLLSPPTEPFVLAQFGATSFPHDLVFGPNESDPFAVYGNPFEEASVSDVPKPEPQPEDAL